MLCHYHLLLAVCLICLVDNCRSSTSEYLIIRHGRSRVRHSSEKDHIRWGLQVFDNFTLLDYDTVDDSNETATQTTTSTSGNGSGAGGKWPGNRGSSANSPIKELRLASWGTGGKFGGADQFSDSSNNSDTLTIQFNESEELDRMIDISDFDGISVGRVDTQGRRQMLANNMRNNRSLVSSLLPGDPSPATRAMPHPNKKMLKKEIMENIKKTVDKGLEYLKSHKNLDEVKIELKAFHANAHEKTRHDSEEQPTTSHSWQRKNFPNEEGAADTAPLLLAKVIPSHERRLEDSQKRWPMPKYHQEQHGQSERGENYKEFDPLSSQFSNTKPSLAVAEQSRDVSHRHPIVKDILKVTSSGMELGGYQNDSPDRRDAGRKREYESGEPAEGSAPRQPQRSEPIKSQTDSRAQKFNYDPRTKLTLQGSASAFVVGDGSKSSADGQVVDHQMPGWRPPEVEVVPYGGGDADENDEVINILNDTPTISFEPNEADASSTMIFQGGTDPDDADSDPPGVWVSDDAENLAADDDGEDVVVPDGLEVDLSKTATTVSGGIFRMEDFDLSELDETSRNNRRNLMKGQDVVTQFLQIVESQHLLGSNCTAGTALNLGDGVVDRYAQDRFRVEAEIAVNRANMLTRIFKFSAPEVQMSEHLLHASVLSMVEFDDDIFAAGNCFDWNQHPAKKGLFCPFAYRLPPPDQGASLAKDLAAEYHYLGNTSEWFFLARKNAEKVIARNEQYIKSFHIYSNNTIRQADEILSVKYEDGRWSKPYYDCGGGNIWMLTYTVPFFGYENGTYFFKGTSGIDIDLRRVDIDQCPQKNLPSGTPQPLNIFAGTDKCKQRTTECTPIPGLGFRRGSYRCVCRKGFYFPDTAIQQKWFNGTTLEEEYEKLMLKELSTYNEPSSYQCLPCAEGCDSCIDSSPCVAALNWTMRTGILVLACSIIGLLPPAAVFTFRYQQVKVVRAASPALLRVIALGAFFIYCTTVVMYPPPSLYTCTARVWLREIGFSLTYGALMLKTWRISVIFRVRSAKAVKITDAFLLKRLGLLCGFVGIALLVRTLVAPPVVIVGRTADNLKAFLCKTDWWDHTFTSMEVLFLAWGVRLCIMVRKAPSEFNESRFISMAIYNEFLLTCFLNVSMLFLQSPANPDLLYIIFFCHTQLTVTLLLGLIFGSKVYLVLRGGGKHQDDSTGLGIKPSGAKFISRSHGRTFANASSVTTSTAQMGAGNVVNEGRLTEDEATEEIKQLCAQLQRLYERIPQRGVAIVTIASLLETCKNSSLKPPLPPGGTKAIMAAATGNDTVGQKLLDKSTNTNTLPNGNHGGDVWAHGSNARITITDDSDQQNHLRSIDNSNFNLDSLQLKCMCSEEEVEESRCDSHHKGGVIHSCKSKPISSSCKLSHECCDSEEGVSGAVLSKRNSELTLNNSSCFSGNNRIRFTDNPANSSICKLSDLSAKNFESCDNLLHQQHKQKQKQHYSGDSLDNHSNRKPNSSSGSGLVSTTSSLSIDEKNFKNLNLENFNKLYASHNNKIDSLKENFLMRTALTTALHNLENENRVRNHRSQLESLQLPQSSNAPQKTPSNNEGSLANVSCSSSSSCTAGTLVAQVPASTTSNSGSGCSSIEGSSSATTTATTTPTTAATDQSNSQQQTTKKKKSPEKRLVIDLNDRSKYTEEVSV
ncbi:uncharacterized protein LOC129755136 [Uranotaenia lowii]|uniref:uncharacterized protein LOC129755136 n=1 Tax=Uranotaenia lowii TaxID=190385 RepID=UPI002478586C|nr:uncharacterized protein LOC129755136 [Uranotaenia lowii]XP_055607464.1 uncharacterized protein LOC129755136 [Uranotaenia lowii]